MQTFLPYSDFAKSASVLDWRRLGKQRVEAWQIYLAITDRKYGWQAHPAVNMWRGYENHLLEYGIKICSEWISRGYNDSMLERFKKRVSPDKSFPEPFWLGDERLHSSHRSALLAKDFDHYGKYNWSEEAMDLNKKPLDYWWPKNKPTTPMKQTKPKHAL